MRTGRNADEFQLTFVANPPFLYLWTNLVHCSMSMLYVRPCFCKYFIAGVYLMYIQYGVVLETIF